MLIESLAQVVAYLTILLFILVPYVQSSSKTNSFLVLICTNEDRCNIKSDQYRKSNQCGHRDSTLE